MVAFFYSIKRIKIIGFIWNFIKEIILKKWMNFINKNNKFISEYWIDSLYVICYFTPRAKGITERISADE